MIYIYLLFFTLLSHLFKRLRNSQEWYIIFVTIICIFLCGGYMCGSDWRAYEMMYDKVRQEDFLEVYIEPGYYLYMLIFKMLHVGFWPFFIFTKMIVFLCYVHLIRKYAYENFYLVMLFFLAWFGFYLFIDNPMRNLIATMFFLFSIKYVLQRKMWKYFLCILFAISFHYSAFLFLFSYFFINKRISTRWLIFLFIIINILFSNRELILYLIDSLFGNIPIVQMKVEWYLENESNPDGQGKLFSLGMIVHILFFILLVKYREKIEQRRGGQLIFNMSVFYLFLYRLGLTVDVFSRFQLYLALFYSIGIASLVVIWKFNARWVYVTYLLALSLIASQKIFADYRYIPYSNYFFYAMKGHLPDYSYRSSYNHIHSPYSDKDVYKKE